MNASASLASDFASSSALGPLRKLAIEDVLRWVVRDELPKRHDDDRHYFNTGGSIHPMWRHGVFGARIENWSKEPGMPLAAGDPHPDALEVEAAWTELDLAIRAALKDGTALPLDLSGYGIGEGLGPNLDLAPILRRAIAGTVPWLLTMAKRGGLPDWGTGPLCKPGYGRQGQVTLWITEEELVGEGKDGTPWYTRTDRTTTPVRAGLYRPGTFCKVVWERDAKMVAEDRATYASWHAGLTWLSGRLSAFKTVETSRGPVEIPTLSSVMPKVPAVPASPWITPPTVPSVLRAVEGGLSEEGPSVPRKRDGLGRRLPAPVRKVDPAEWRPAARMAA